MHPETEISKKAIRVNKVIALLTTSDIFTWGLFLVTTTITGLYLVEKLNLDEGEIVKIVGIGAGIYSIVKGILQIPIGVISDKIKSDTDDILFLFFGNLLMGLPFIFYPNISEIYMYYILQGVLGFGSAMNLVNWRKLFAKNLDTNKEGLQYGTYDAVMSLSVAVFSIIAGSIASLSPESFDKVMLGIGILMMSSGIWALLIIRVTGRKSK